VKPPMLAILVTMVAVPVSYGMVLLAVLYAYRKGYEIVGKPELAFRFAARTLCGPDGFTRP
jgi:hypothetical protein